MELKKRLTSVVTWVAIIGYVGTILVSYSPELNEHFQLIATGVLGILVALGVINNPTDRKHL